MIKVHVSRAVGAMLAASMFCAAAQAQSVDASKSPLLECVVKESNGKGYIKYEVGHAFDMQRSAFVESADGSKLTYEKAKETSLVISRWTGEFTWTAGDQSSSYGPPPGIMKGLCKLKPDTRKF